MLVGLGRLAVMVLVIVSLVHMRRIGVGGQCDGRLIDLPCLDDRCIMVDVRAFGASDWRGGLSLMAHISIGMDRLRIALGVRRVMVVMVMIVMVMIVAVIVMVAMVIVVMPVVVVMIVVVRVRLDVAMHGVVVLTMRLIVAVVLEWLRGVGEVDGCAFDDLAADALAMAAPTRAAMARTPAIRTVFRFFFRLAMGAFVSLDQRLPIGDGDLVVVRMDFAEGEKAVPVAAIFNEGGLQRRFDPCDLGEIDIAAELLALRRLEIKLFDSIAADHHDPGFFRMGGIDQHLVGHLRTLGGGARVCRPAQGARRGTATVHLIRG